MPPKSPVMVCVYSTMPTLWLSSIVTVSLVICWANALRDNEEAEHFVSQRLYDGLRNSFQSAVGKYLSEWITSQGSEVSDCLIIPRAYSVAYIWNIVQDHSTSQNRFGTIKLFPFWYVDSRCNYCKWKQHCSQRNGWHFAFCRRQLGFLISFVLITVLNTAVRAFRMALWLTR